MISYQINNIIHWIMTSSDKFKNVDGEYVTLLEKYATFES